MDPAGKLIDGQHRCLAAMQVNKPFRTVVLYGNWPFKALGVGKTRSAADVLGIDKLPNAVLLAAVARTCILHARCLATEVSPIGARANPEFVASNEEIYAWTIKHPEVGELVVMAKTLAGGGTLFPLSPVLAAWFLCSQAHKAVADPWYEGLITGETLHQGDIRLALRRFYERRRGEGRRQLRSEHVFADICKAWNQRARKMARNFKRLDTEPFAFIR